MTDKEQPKDVHEAADVQVGVTDMPNRVSEIMHDAFGFARMNMFGSTNFEGHSLNAMIDLVENTKPEELERAGEALWKARDAISAAAKELSEHIDRVEWEGEAGDAFRKWGRNLAKDSNLLADYAEVAGVQITAAGTGLASVRKAMPPRDTRTDKKTVDDIPTPGRVEGNEDYAAALKVEKDRQEAINQMNRLASFYSVSEQTLAASEPPTFSTMPDLGVPKPASGGGWGGREEQIGAQGGGGRQAGSPHAAYGHVGTASEGQPGGTELGQSIAPPVAHVGTEIDSVATLPTVNAPTTNTPVSTSSGTPSSTGTPMPFAPGFVKTGASGPSKSLTASGGPRATGQTQASARQSAARTGNPAATGRAGNPAATGRAGNPAATGRAAANAANRTAGPMGRAAATGQGTAGGRSSASARSPMGRPVSGGTPRATGANNAPRSGATGAARSNGVVGGRPTGAAPSGSGSRVPRGTVIGGEKSAAARNPGAGTGARVRQRGVIGNPGATSGEGRSAGARSTANADGVVGAPQGRAAGPRNTRGVPTAGGAGLVRSSPSNSRSAHNAGRSASRKAEEGTTDEESTPPGQGSAPPVTDRREQGRSEA
ncbi:hypothetical protein ACFYQQ_35495 [Streptomyces sp. NPDC005496]|uniref:hypothetical protein n=1 Tax=unclassified Streptomyces TaxID=2593676 RepID=UPI00339FAC1F